MDKQSADNNLKGVIAWMTKNAVAANLLMVIILLGGFLAVFRLKQEVFPEFDLDVISVSCTYPGASPTDIEQGIILAIEETVRGVDGVKRVTAKAMENVGSVTLELQLNAKSDKVLNDVKNQIDRIITFPADMESPIVSLLKTKMSALSVVISGDEPHSILHGIAEKMRSDFLAHPEISQVELQGVRPLEIAIEIPQENLKAYGLSLDKVAAQIRMFSIEMPGGSIDSRSGTIQVRLSDRRLTRADFEDIVIKGSLDGQEVRLGDIAQIIDGYADTDLAFTFNGKPAVVITANRVGSETPITVAKAVKECLKKSRKELPASIGLTIWDDNSVMLKERIALLVNNAVIGLLLVAVILTLFLKKRLAFWVSLGIPVSFFGAFLLMGPMGVTINMMSLFALLMVLGMVVDDAIVVAENIYQKTLDGISPVRAAIEGAKEMVIPVTFSVLTTITAFFPLLAVPGVMGKIFYIIPAVVILVLLFSWLESFLILPAHLSHQGSGKKTWLHKALAWVDFLQEKSNRMLVRFIENSYQPFLKTVLRHRYPSIGIALAILIIVAGFLPAGIIDLTFMPKIEGNVVSASVRLPYGVPIERTEETSRIFYSKAKEALEKTGLEENSQGIFIRIGTANGGANPMGISSEGSHLMNLSVDLGPADDRDMGTEEFAHIWKTLMPSLPGIESFTIGSEGGPSAGKAVDIELYHTDMTILGEASEWLFTRMQNYSGLTDVENSFSAGKPQLDFSIRTGAYALGITPNDIGRTLRSSFFGAEAIREQRGRNELKVMVRLPEHQRIGEHAVEQLFVPSPGSGFVPLYSIAKMTRTKAPTEITREDGQRKLNVSAELVPGAESASEIIRELKKTDLQELSRKFPGIRYAFGGQQREMKESFGALGRSYLLAMFVIFALLAIPFKSYGQPLIVMSAIPFGIVGAFMGHLLLGYNISLISAMGIIALSGVVVNDSLVFVDATNKYRLQGVSVYDALIQAGMRRFRPILLTSLTTFFGLLPMLLETSMQARFLIPMAISLAFGILFTTVVSLLIVPVLYLLFENVKSRIATGVSIEIPKQ